MRKNCDHGLPWLKQVIFSHIEKLGAELSPSAFQESGRERSRVDEEVEELEEGEWGSSPVALRALTVVRSAGDRAVRVRWLLSLIRPAHSRS